MQQNRLPACQAFERKWEGNSGRSRSAKGARVECMVFFVFHIDQRDVKNNYLIP